MITIPIRSVANETDGYDESSTEWALIELNGELIPPKLSRSHDTNDNNEAYTIELGSIHFDSKGTPIMIIGSHELKGVCQTLARPFVMLQPEPKNCDQKMKSTYVDQVIEEMTEVSKGYSVAGIISKKILFNSYPKIIMRSN